MGDSPRAPQPQKEQPRKRTFPPVPVNRTLADLDQFWTDWEPVIRRVGRAKLRTARVPRGLADVDDVVQHVHLRLREEWEEPSFENVDPGRFALGSVMNDFIRTQVHELRNRAHRPGSHAEGAAGEQPAPEPGPEDVVLHQEVEEYLRSALDGLPEKQRRAVELSVGEEVPRDQIAAEIGVQVGTVSSHRARGLRGLAEALSPLRMDSRVAAQLTRLAFAGVLVLTNLIISIRQHGLTDTLLYVLVLGPVVILGMAVLGAVMIAIAVLIDELLLDRWRRR